MNIYKKIKAQNGEKFAQALRKEVPVAMDDMATINMLKFVGSDPQDVYKISALVHSLLLGDEKNASIIECPLELLSRAGYDAYVVTNKTSQDSISQFFAKGEELCTFGTDRYKAYNIINAVKKNVSSIKRENFKNPEREDEYGTSVISIQVKDGFISIKNRYNHKVSNCDATFGNNLDSIIKGLKQAIEYRFNIKLGSNCTVPGGFMIIKGCIFKVVKEINGIYYGNNAIIKNGEIIEMDEGDYLYEYFIFSMKTKKLRIFDEKIKDSFPDDFNKFYGGKKSLRVSKNGDLMDSERVLFKVHP